jgi:hybrid cluster-associated redox disulfide protein
MIRKDWSIEELLARYPRSREILIRWGMWCLVCALAGLETLADAARVYGIDIETLIRELEEQEGGGSSR